MTVTQRTLNRYLERPAPSSLADVIDTILDKGLVIDIHVCVSLVGIELLTIDARIVSHSVDTYLRFAEAVNRLDLTQDGSKGLPELSRHYLPRRRSACNATVEDCSPPSDLLKVRMANSRGVSAIL